MKDEINALLGFGFDVYNTAKNAQLDKFNMDMANRNADLQESVFDWQRQTYEQDLDYKKSLQQQLFSREDTAYQRAVDDARKAGLSPLAVSGGAGAGSVVSTSGSNASAGSVSAQLQRQQARLDVASQMASIRSMIDQNRINKEIGKAEVEKIKADTNYTKAQEIQTLHNVENDKTGNTVQERIAFSQAVLQKELNNMSFEQQKWLNQQAHDLQLLAQKDAHFYARDLEEFKNILGSIAYSNQLRGSVIQQGVKYVYDNALQKSAQNWEYYKSLISFVSALMSSNGHWAYTTIKDMFKSGDGDLQKIINGVINRVGYDIGVLSGITTSRYGDFEINIPFEKDIFFRPRH